jgi:hypothetical protein
MVGKPKLPNWLAYIRPHIAPYQALGRGERRKYIEKLSKQTKLSDNSLRRFIAAAQFLEAEGITTLPPGGRLPLGAVEHIARIAARDPSRRRALLEDVVAGRMTIEQVAAELEKIKKSAKRRPAGPSLSLEHLAIDELKTTGFDLEGMKVINFEEHKHSRYFDAQMSPTFVFSCPEPQGEIVVMDGRQVAGTDFSFMRQRKEFLRNVLVAASLFKAVVVYAPHWKEDVDKLVYDAQPEVGSRILRIESPDLPEEPIAAEPAGETPA